MKNVISWKKIFVIIFIAFISQNLNADKNFSDSEVKEDFNYLYETLKDTSYDLFYFTEKSVFDQEFKQTNSSITGPMTILEINRLLRRFTALAKFSHCKVEFPSESFREFYKNGGRFFPLELLFVDNKSRVILDYTKNKNISLGDELISLNGKPFASVLKEMYLYIGGENEYSMRTTVVESGNFFAYYWYVFGDFEPSVLVLKNKEGTVFSVKTNGTDIKEYKKHSPELPTVTDSDRRFKFVGKVAYLHPGIFLNRNAKTDDINNKELIDKEEFRQFIDSTFRKIYERKSKDLIIDIRGNNGGTSMFSNYMISYFANKPFYELSKMGIKTSRLVKDVWKDYDIPELAELKKKIMTLKNGTRIDLDPMEVLPRNDKFRFKGNVYVLIDRFSYSNATAAASIIQDYSFGTLIGEETSDLPSSCGGMQAFKLPNTGIEVYFTKGCGVRPSGDTSRRGVIPDVPVKQDFFTENDEVLEYTLKIIQSNQ